ncbi:receptor-like protein 12 [Gossypium australe]|uniref:Receptor-like protein 12 n=1 Tax=Gossypium australe TaxID=47621 RepID=A0A5B6VI29_9ROSI|nr:receptor-like protein 12 [Gossypium australe]
MNGAVEAANKNIKKIMGKMIETYKYWHEKLPYAYGTLVRTSTGATPFSLVYGMDAVLPIEVEIPSLRVLSELKLDEAELIQSRYDQLNLIEEKRLKAIRHDQAHEIDSTGLEQIENGESCLPKVAMEQIKATNLISLKLQRSRLKTVNLVSLKLQWNRFKLQVTNHIPLKSRWDGLNYESQLPGVIVEQIEDSKFHFSEVAVEKIKATSHKYYTSNVAVGRINSTKTKPYLPEVAVEQTEDSKSYLPKVAVEQIEATSPISWKWIEALVPIPLKMLWDGMNLLEEERHQTIRDSARQDKIGPFKVFALFPLYDNKQRRAATKPNFSKG